MHDTEDELYSSKGGAMMSRRPRTRLPAAKPLGRGFSIWSVLKNMIGKDLTKITMPATINEPLSFTQRLAEAFEYYHLVDQAAVEQDSMRRLMLGAVGHLTCYNQVCGGGVFFWLLPASDAISMPWPRRTMEDDADDARSPTPLIICPPKAQREGKPFNPLLGETYEWQPVDGSVK